MTQHLLYLIVSHLHFSVVNEGFMLDESQVEALLLSNLIKDHVVRETTQIEKRNALITGTANKTIIALSGGPFHFTVVGPKSGSC